MSRRCELGRPGQQPGDSPLPAPAASQALCCLLVSWPGVLPGSLPPVDFRTPQDLQWAAAVPQLWPSPSSQIPPGIPTPISPTGRLPTPVEASPLSEADCQWLPGIKPGPRVAARHMACRVLPWGVPSPARPPAPGAWWPRCPVAFWSGSRRGAQGPEAPHGCWPGLTGEL